jgi:hypothetical protein
MTVLKKKIKVTVLKKSQFGKLTWQTRVSPERKAASMDFVNSVDLVQNISSHVKSVLHLGMLCGVNKAFKRFLYSFQAGPQWREAGKAICGEAHWKKAKASLTWYPINPMMHVRNLRYETMMTLCPWKSLPCYYAVEPLRGGDQAATVQWMNVTGEGALTFCTVSASVEQGGSKRVVVRVPAFTDPTEPPNGWFKLHHAPSVCPCEPPPADWRIKERAFFNRLQAQEWRPAAMHPDSQLQRVYEVYNGLFCAVYYSTRPPPYSQTHAYFVHEATLKVVHVLEGTFTKHLVIRPGGIWALQRNLCVLQLTSRRDKALAPQRIVAENVLWAAYRGEMDVAFAMLEAIPATLDFEYPEERGWRIGPFTQIYSYVIQGGKPEALRRLLERDGSFAGAHSLELAVEKGSLEMVRLLIDHKADPSAHNSHILHVAIKSPNTTCEMLQLLVQHGASVRAADTDTDDGWDGLVDSATQQTPVEVRSFFVEAGMRPEA